MAATGYAVLKKHFDKLFVGGYPGNGFEPIRTVYETAFDRKINLFDVYQTDLRCAHNPVNGIITLVGPDEGETPYGTMMCNDSIVHVCVISEDFLKGISAEGFKEYVNFVYNSMHNIVVRDRFYWTDEDARANAYVSFIKCVPFYFTWHHCKTHLQHIFQVEPFKELMEKFILSDEEEESKVFESLKSAKYSEDPCIIYRTMTCAGTVDLFW